ncbi:PfkB family carbohydrate kinase [Actibacterium lipolyticum]|uniref:Pseudouridine kinase n=1 Tax=Actibacterium lipolyticum TaxID=1524263 RepID=A0A238JWK0_9RHOB|nr:PfkB family carbohydrate kinase [Actibacterium lipolyticum]SMX35048.1 Pseudouridine kinase [Actibacterium lipolyticum]
MTATHNIICIGSVLWDVIGRAPNHLSVGSDVPGRITRLPGGVAMNIAMTLRRFGLVPALLSAIGEDEEGRELVATCTRMGMVTDYIYRSADLPTDRYMAVEGGNGLIAAIADAHSLEAAGAKILTALEDGRLGSAKAPYAGPIAIDGNLTEELLQEIAKSPLFANADLRIAPASPGKAERLQPLLGHQNGTLYVNLEEAGLMCLSTFETSRQAAEALMARGAHRVLVTNGGEDATMATPGTICCQTPPPVMVTRVTGAGDTFMAAHIAAELRGDSPDDALSAALKAAAVYVSGETPL